MGTLLIHFISDFLRDETLRCAVMENEDDTYARYDGGLNATQIDVLHKVRDKTFGRKELLQAISDEIAPFRFETGAGEVLQYPAGDVQIHKFAVESGNNHQRTIRVVGIGFIAGVAVTFTKGTDAPIAPTNIVRSCDTDVWQRLEITVTLPPGTYTMRIEREGGVHAEETVTV